MLRAGLLIGSTIALHRVPADLTAALEGLGATTVALPGDDPPDEEALAAASGAQQRADTLLCDARGAFTAAGAGYPGLRAGLDGAFAAARAAATAHWIDRDRAGRVVLVAPAPGAGEHATALRAALENTVRTLATEWARHAVTTVAVLPGDATTPGELADLVGWLASPAGAYVSGTALTLR